MVQWAQTRQRAIDDARAHAAASGVTNVTLLYRPLPRQKYPDQKMP
jgi:hypothetical protein